VEEEWLRKDAGELRCELGREFSGIMGGAKAVGNVAEEKKYTLLHGWLKAYCDGG